MKLPEIMSFKMLATDYDEMLINRLTLNSQVLSKELNISFKEAAEQVVFDETKEFLSKTIKEQIRLRNIIIENNKNIKDIIV